MALYDMRCEQCNTTVERRCLMDERVSQTCATCGALLALLFSPPSTFVIPQAFQYAYSDLFGTSSEKEYLKANPTLVPSREVRTEHPRSKARRRKVEADKTVADIERAISANKTLAGGTKTEV